MVQGPHPKGSGRGKAYSFDLYDEEDSLDDLDGKSGDTASDDEDDDQGGRPDTVERRCTDVGWLLPFVLALTALSWVVQYALQNGDLTHFRAFMDLQGKYCLPHSGEQYLYFCMNHPGQLNISNPICVSSCPNDTKIEHSFACEAYGIFKNTTDYSTEPYFGMMCKPMQMKLRGQVQDYLIQTRHSVVKRLSLRSPQTALGCMLLAAVASYMYLSFIGRCAGVVVWTGLMIAILVPTLFGLYLMGWTTWVGLVPRPYQLMGELDANPVIGAGLLFIGASCACCFMRMSVSVDKAMQCLEEAIECCMDTPVLQWQPVFHLVLNIATNLPTIVGIVFLLSCQDISLAYKDQGALVHLLLLTPKQCLYLAFLVFMYVWIMHTHLMASTFVITYITQLWCYSGDDEGQGYVQNRALFKAYWAVYRYHFGSVVKGGLAVGLTRPVRLVMGMVVGFTEMKANAVGALISTACCFCIACYERWFEHLNKSAFIEVALNARSFCPAAKVHMRITDTEADTRRILHGASRVFQWAGITIICSLCGLAMVIARTTEGGFNAESERQLMLAQITFLVLGLLVAFLVAVPFMMLFHIVADTILYIRTVEKLRSIRKNEWTWSPNVLQCVCCKRVRPDLPSLGDRGYEDVGLGLDDDRPSSSDKRGRSARSPSGRSQRAFR